MGKVGGLERVGRPLTDQSRHQRAESEAGRQRDGGSSRRGAVGLSVRQVGDPGAGSREHDAGADAGQQPGHSQAGHRVVLHDQQHRRHRREQDERQHHRTPTPPVRGGTSHQQRRHQPESVDTEENGPGLGRHADLVSVGDEDRRELVGSPPDRKHRERDSLPGPHLANGRASTLRAGLSQEAERQRQRLPDRRSRSWTSRASPHSLPWHGRGPGPRPARRAGWGRSASTTRSGPSAIRTRTPPRRRAGSPSSSRPRPGRGRSR